MADIYEAILYTMLHSGDRPVVCILLLFNSSTVSVHSLHVRVSRFSVQDGNRTETASHQQPNSPFDNQPNTKLMAILLLY